MSRSSAVMVDTGMALDKRFTVMRHLGQLGLV